MSRVEDRDARRVALGARRGRQAEPLFSQRPTRVTRAQRAGAGARRIALGSLLTFAATAVLAAPAWAQLTVSTGQPVSVTTTGAVVDVTVNPAGTDALAYVNYGVTGQSQSTQSMVTDAGSGTSPVTVAVVIDQLQPGTSYTYSSGAQTPDGNTNASDPTTATFTTAVNPTGPGLPSVPPQNPPNAIFGYPCDISFENGLAPSADAACLSDINGARAALESLPPLVLPSNWSTLTPGEQIFVATNLERVSRGEAPISNLVNTYDDSIQTALSTFTDPSPNLAAPWTSVASTGSDTPLGAVYGWLYDDGPGGTNIDCPTATSQGCWGHRDALLSNAATIGNPTEMDAGAGTSTAGATTDAALFVNNPNPTPAANIVFSWASEQQFLAPPTLGGAVSHSPAPKLSRLTLSRTKFTAQAGKNAPAIILDTQLQPSLGTVISYTDSERATTTFTVEQQLTGVTSHGKCVASPSHKQNSAVACTFSKTLGSLQHTDVKGSNRFRYVGRLNGQRLAPGDYLMKVTPANSSGRQGKTLELNFEIAR